ncbi:MAG: hypothetical protein M3Z14_01000 [Candidatus Eremiobacteraeota bacterium]|nr:hypothetical protein [Candidatus Eremiobacteraeota bacterium]
MFNNLQNMLQQVTGGGADSGAVERAATDHVSSMDSDELTGHMPNAADNLQQDGQGGLAQQLSGIISEKQTDPAGLKDAAVNFIKNNPQVLAHFAPPFAQGLLGRLGV